MRTCSANARQCYVYYFVIDMYPRFSLRCFTNFTNFIDFINFKACNSSNNIIMLSDITHIHNCDNYATPMKRPSTDAEWLTKDQYPYNTKIYMLFGPIHEDHLILVVKILHCYQSSFASVWERSGKINTCYLSREPGLTRMVGQVS